MDQLRSIFGEGSDLSISQMALRGVVVLVLTLAMIRLAGRRAFGQHSPFDACLTVLLGSILGRCVVGASPFWPTIATGVVLALCHRAMAMLAIRSVMFDRWINGRPRVLARDGELNRGEMARALVIEADLRQAVRENALSDDLAEVHAVILERNGSLSVVREPA